MSLQHSVPAPAPAATSRHTGRLLRLALRLDAVITGAIGVASIAGADPLSPALGVPGALLVPVGVFLTIYV